MIALMGAKDRYWVDAVGKLAEKTAEFGTDPLYLQTVLTLILFQQLFCQLQLLQS